MTFSTKIDDVDNVMALHVNEAYCLTLKNGSGSSCAPGDVVIQDTSQSLAFTTTTTSKDPNVIGVVVDGCLNGNDGLVQNRGVAGLVKVSGAVAIGDYLATTTQAGYSASVGTVWCTGVFAIAMVANVSGNGYVLAVLINPHPGSVWQINSAAGDPKLLLSVGDAVKWYIGADYDDNSKLKIGAGSAVGTSEMITIDSTQIALNVDAADIDFRVYDDAGNALVFLDAGAGTLELGYGPSLILYIDSSINMGPPGATYPLNIATGGTVTLGYGSAGLAVNADGTLAQNTNVIRAVFNLTGIADNVATAVFTITTQNETGNTDGGGYSCFMHWLLGHGLTSSGGHDAVMGAIWQFVRAQVSTGIGTNSAALKIAETAEVNTAASRLIASEVVTITETSEYVQTVYITLDLSGSAVTTGEVTVMVELAWTGFLTPPILAAA